MPERDRLSKLFEFLVKINPDYSGVPFEELADMVHLLDTNDWVVNKAARELCQPTYSPKSQMSKADFHRAMGGKSKSNNVTFDIIFK